MDSILNSLNDIVSVLEKLTRHNLFDYFAYILIPAFAIALPIIFINRNTNKQIANQNKETYRPRLKFAEFKVTSGNDNYQYLYNSIQYKSNIAEDIGYTIYCDVILENIGNGLANDITFYSLHDGEKCIRYLIGDEDKSQIHFSTEEIEKGGKVAFHFYMIFDQTKIKYPEGMDSCLLICNYKDLNCNNYKLLIGIVLKKLVDRKNFEGLITTIKNYGNFDKYYLQEGTKDFNDVIENYKKQYSRILQYIKNT